MISKIAIVVNIYASKTGIWFTNKLNPDIKMAMLFSIAKLAKQFKAAP